MIEKWYGESPRRVEGPATLATGAIHALVAPFGNASRSGELSGRAYGGHRVGEIDIDRRVSGHAESLLAAASCNSATATGSSGAGVSRMSMLTVHRSGIIQ
jgi:hypothetical protein